MQRGFKVRALTRSAEKAAELLGKKEGLEVVVADARQPESLQSVTDGVAAVAAVTGTTAFPSKRCARHGTVPGKHAAPCHAQRVGGPFHRLPGALQSELVSL
jgi:uncharacterized protein YbjT (DUF2867 family)